VRSHTFVLEGMRANAERCEQAGVAYYPYVDTAHDAGKGLLEALADHACLVVADDFPAFIHPRLVETATSRLECRLEAVDSNGILPLQVADGAFDTAYAFRRFLQRELRPHLLDFPEANPLRGVCGAEIPAEIARRWPPGIPDDAETLPLDSSVGAVELRGGSSAGEARVREFLDAKLEHYEQDRNKPDEDVASGLSPYLHFGHVSSHAIVRGLLDRAGWEPDHLSPRTDGKRRGWWGLPSGQEAFLDQLVTWRELGFNAAVHMPRYEEFDSLPAWALKTLEEHEADERPHLYSLDEFADAGTHDPLWNAAQRQLRQTGVIHNYLRMLWGKKILEWSRSPRDAAKIMIELNNRFALDGRDPNSYSGIYWVLGRYDRAWGPERPIFGKIRYMTSAKTARKVSVRGYLPRFAPPD
jgi:deoxyribodipyrimidine photo-lyase